MEIKKQILIRLTFVGVTFFLLLFLDYNSSFFGKSFIFSSPVRKFDFQLDIIDAKYMVESSKFVRIISENEYFVPTSSESFFIKEVEAICPKNEELYVLVLDSLSNNKTIIIKNIDKSGFVSNDQVLNGYNNAEWIYLDKSNYLQSKIYLRWHYYIWVFIFFFIISIALLIFKIQKNSNKNTSHDKLLDKNL